MAAFTPTTTGVIVTVKVQPRASRNGLAGIDPDWVRIRLQAPPVEGRANTALIDFLSQTLQIAKSAITIMTGTTGRLKRVRIHGLEAARVQEILTTHNAK